MKKQLALTLACSESDHVHDFTCGAIEAEGIDLTYLPLPIEEMFFRFTTYGEFDVSEMSLGKYVSMRSQGNESLIAIPVFPSRMFRHSAIYVRTGSAITRPEDMRGRRIGIAEWAQTAAIYARGMLAEEYGVALTGVQWVQGGVAQPGREEKVALQLPDGVRLERVRDRSLDAMLVAGEIDALISAHAPPSFEAPGGGTVRLFPDYHGVELAYFRKTGIYPIMHVIGLRGPILAEHPWVARSLFKAFDEAKRRSCERLADTGHSGLPVPWGSVVARDIRTDFGDDWFPYGIEANRTTLEAFVRFSYEQGSAHRLVPVEELFPASMQQTFRI